MKKERIEDLGRLEVLLSNLLNDDLFDEQNLYSSCFLDWFEKLDTTTKEAALIAISRGIDRVHDAIYECRNIAWGDEE